MNLLWPAPRRAVRLSEAFPRLDTVGSNSSTREKISASVAIRSAVGADARSPRLSQSTGIGDQSPRIYVAAGGSSLRLSHLTALAPLQLVSAELNRRIRRRRGYRGKLRDWQIVEVDDDEAFSVGVTACCSGGVSTFIRLSHAEQYLVRGSLPDRVNHS